MLQKTTIRCINEELNDLFEHDLICGVKVGKLVTINIEDKNGAIIQNTRNNYLRLRMRTTNNMTWKIVDISNNNSLSIFCGCTTYSLPN